MARWRFATCCTSRWESSGSVTASESRRRAVTGVRSRCDRSATAARSLASSSVVRSASPFSASASSTVSSVPLMGARAVRSPSRSRCAARRPRAPGRSPDARAGSRWPARRGEAPDPDRGCLPRPERRRGAASADVTVVRTTAVPSPDHRQQRPATVPVHDRERLTGQRSLHLGVVGRDSAGTELAAGRREHAGLGAARASSAVTSSSSWRRRAGWPPVSRRCAPPGPPPTWRGPGPGSAPAGTAG